MQNSNKVRNYLAIDLGASSGRGIIGRFDGSRISLEETHRFQNGPVNVTGRMYWDILGIYSNIRQAIQRASAECELASIGIDTWGVDYGIIGKDGRLLSNPCHYRDSRTDDILQYTDKLMTADEIYRATGIQTMNFNTVFQLAADMRDNPHIFSADAVSGSGNKILFIPDLLNYFLTGVMATEYTIASTGAVLDPYTQKYSDTVLDGLGIPKDIFCGEPVMPGTVLGRLNDTDISESCQAKVVTVASHDTASAVLSVPTSSDRAVYISSGTWSLMGTELSAPLINDQTRRLNYTNEGGVGGTIRFLKNIMGLWILQECRRRWAAEGHEYSFGELTGLAAKSDIKPFASIINPDLRIFASPGNMPQRIRDYCRRTGQTVPQTVGETVRCVIDSLALCYRYTAENLSALTGIKPDGINIVGGGCQNGLLSQMTADAAGLPVTAGPVEATSVGNILSQLISDGEVSGIKEARQLVAESFEMQKYEPGKISESSDADASYEKFTKLLLSDK